MNLYDELCKRALLKKIWKEIYTNKSVPRRATSRGIDGITLEAFKDKEDEYLDKIQILLKKKIYKFSPSKAVAIPKEDNSYRMIAMQIIADRIIHRAILSLITKPMYPLVNTGVSYCGVKSNFWNKKEKSLNRADAIKKIIEHLKKGNFWIFETDIESFFDEIPKEKIFKKVLDALQPDASLKDILGSAIKFEIGNPLAYERANKELPNEYKGVPQGSSLSPILSNLYLVDFDNYMKKRFNDRYIRYADDFIIMCKTKDDVSRAKRCARYKIKQQQLKLKLKKTHTFNIKNKPLEFLGLKIDRNAIVPKKTIGQIKQSLIKKVINPNEYSVVYRSGKKIPLIQQINEKILGWAYGYKFFHIKKYFEEIDKLILSRIKCSKGKLKELELIKKNINLEPIISIENWKKIFTGK